MSLERNLFIDTRLSPAHTAFAIFAIVVFVAPVDAYIARHWQWAAASGFPVGATVKLAVLAAMLLTVPTLRAACRDLLRVWVPKDKTVETALVLVLYLIAAFGSLGALALWTWSLGGEPALARHVGEQVKSAHQWSIAMSPGGIFGVLILGAVVAPIVEEIVFRGMLYPVLARQWGWLAGALGTSVACAAVHPGALVQFAGSLLLICLLRRTGSLRACIAVHASFNFLMWHPLLGQFLFPGPGRETGELSYWAMQLACLAIAFFAIPIYAWIAGGSADAHLSMESELQHS